MGIGGRVNSTFKFNHSYAINNFPKFRSEKSKLLLITPRLGYSFDSRTGLPNAANCLANYNVPESSIDYTHPKGAINLTNSLSTASMSSLLNASVSGSVNYGLFSASVNATYS